jgi:hypothetical protein
MSAPIILQAWHNGAMIGAEELEEGADAMESAAAMLDRLAAEDRPYPDFVEVWAGASLLSRKSPRNITIAAAAGRCFLARELAALDAWRDETKEAGR